MVQASRSYQMTRASVLSRSREGSEMSTDNLPLRSVDPRSPSPQPVVVAPVMSAPAVPAKSANHTDGERRLTTVAAAPARWQGRHRMPILLALVDGTVTALVLELSGAHWSLVLAGTVLIVLFNLGAGLNQSRFSLSSLDDFPPLFGRGLLIASLVGLSTVVLGYSGIAPVVLFSLPIALFLARALTFQVVRVLRRRGVITHRALILGAGLVGRDLAQAMIDHPSLGIRPVGFVDASPLGGPTGLPVPVVGTPSDLADQIVRLNADHVIIAFTTLRESEMVEMLRTCDRLNADISVVPRLFELAHNNRDTDEIDGINLVRLRRAPFRSPMWRIKRWFDVAVSGLALLVLSPLLGVVALAVRLVDGPGIIFRQERVGLDGYTFNLLKFRSLKPATDTESETRWNIKNDDRMSWLGKVMRKSSVDELPQLVNILKGDMSLVGPRPERPHFVATFDDAFPRYSARHRVPSGLTGWAQIHGLRGDTSIEDRARFDNYYIENWSLWLDIKIMLRTVGTLTKGSG